jgi:hypothetical protein
MQLKSGGLRGVKPPNPKFQSRANLYKGPRFGYRVMNMRRRFLRLLLPCVLMLSGAAARADQMIPLSIKELTSEADVVLQGKVLSTTVKRDPEGRIYTSVDLLVEDVWKGHVATNHFTLVRGGGVLGLEVSEVPEEADYEVGEELVSFMVLNQRGEGVSIGLSQGKFFVTQDAASGEKLVHNRFHGLHPSEPNPPAGIQPASQIQNRLTLAGLKAQVAGGGK